MLRFRGKKIRGWGWNHGIDFKINKHYLFINLDTNGCSYDNYRNKGEPKTFIKKLRKFIKYFKVIECGHSYEQIITWTVTDKRDPKQKYGFDNYGNECNFETFVNFWYSNKLWDKQLNEVLILWRLSSE